MDAKTETIEPGPSAPTVVNPEALSAVLGTEDKRTLAHFYGDFRRTSTGIVDQIQSAYGVGDIQTLGKLAHKLKSSARTVGANGFADCCLSLEQAAKAGDAPEIALQMEHFQPLFERVREWISVFVSAHASDE
jgi:HPt (histidine-containing phosphotransfer) domain-containing protein